MIASVLFWISIFGLGYIFVFYPVVLHVLARSRKRSGPGDDSSVEDQHFDVLMASHNEGSRVQEKAEEVWTAGATLGLRRIVVVLDGHDPEAEQALRDWTPYGGELVWADDNSTLTNLSHLRQGYGGQAVSASQSHLPLSKGRSFITEAKKTNSPPLEGGVPLKGRGGPDSALKKNSDDLIQYGVVVVKTNNRQGKSACLNTGINYCTSDWVVMMDIRQKMGPNCLKGLKKRFSDVSVNVISGNLVFTESSVGSAAPVGAYWTYEKWIRRNESALGCVPGATGACYALRRDAFVSVPEHVVLDDVFIPMAACREEGRCVFEPDAVIYDAPSSDMTQEQLRKRRTIGGIFQLWAVRPGWAFPGGHPFWFSFLSHKLLRLKGPGFLLVAFVSNLFLLDHPVYQILLGLQICFYILALSAGVLTGIPVLRQVSQVIRSFVVLNLVVPAGFWMWITGKIKPVWDRAYVKEKGGP